MELMPLLTPVDDRVTNPPGDLYSTLPLPSGSRSIRVLEIDNSWNGDPQSPIHGNLRIMKLSDKPDFNALSYVWGTFDCPPQTITIGHHDIPVSSNCWSALIHLRTRFGAIAVWIDAICINQGDMKEKEDQVPLMGEIYSLARNVYIWLGEGTPESDRAIDYLSQAGFQKYLPATTGLDPAISCNPANLLVFAFTIFCKNGICGLDHLRRYGTRDFFKDFSRKWLNSLPDSWMTQDILNDFFARVWASRVWTLQEFLLASDPIICCGSRVLPWRSLSRSLLFMELSSAKFPVKIPESTTFKWIGLASIWFSIRQPSAWLRQTSLATGLPEYATFIKRVIDYYLRMYWMLIGTFLFFLVAILLFVLYRLVGALFLELVQEDLGPYVNEWPSWARWLWRTEVDLPWAWLQALGVLVLLLGSIPAVSFGNNDQLQLGGKMNSVEAIIQEIRTRKATNPKDQSYGMHAILQKLGLSLTTPDYSRDLGDIQKELFVQLLIWTKSMNLLLCANGPRSDGKPSWVPDWQLDSEEMWLKPSQLFGRVGNNATPGSDPWWVLHDDDRLVVRGRKINRVDWCGGPFEHTDTVMGYSGTHLHNIIILRDQHRANVERFNAGWGSVFVDTSLRRIHYVDMTEKPARFSNFEHLWALWDGLVRSGDNILLRDVLESMLATPELMEFHTSICNDMAKKGRSVFVTAPHPLATGNCPANTKIGDVIFLVAGVPMPLVLREVPGSDNYQLIGFALVDALMWGQGWADVVEDDLQEIALC